MESPQGTAAPDTDAPPPGNFLFLSSEFGGGERLVKGAPYSAEGVTERTQVLADGNRIVQKSSAMMYRDSEGRTRREQQFGPLGPFASAGQPHRSIFINDPVKAEHFVLEPEDQTAHRMKMPPELLMHHAPPADVDAPDFDVVVAPAPPTGMHQVFQYETNSADARTEPLGKQMMEGVEVEGTRTTTVIPEGQIGNERPIEIVSEKWYSPELQINIMTRHKDPRVGETIYHLQNINRTEPDRSLFQIPAGYKMEEGPAGERIIIKKKIQRP